MTTPPLAVFAGLPAATYLLELLAFGGHAAVSLAHLQAFTHGPAGGAGRTAGP